MGADFQKRITTMKPIITLALFAIARLSFAQVQFCQDIIFPTLNTSLYQGVYYSDMRWEDSKKITVAFLNGDEFLRSKVIKYAPEWSKHANIVFEFVPGPQADIRITFNKGGSWSLIGKQSSQFSVDANSGKSLSGKAGTSMNYGWFNQNTSEQEFRRTILHEFGHALGMLHEHLSPLSGIKWNMPKVYAHYMQTQNWSKEDVDKNVLNKYSITQSNGVYDPKSIMHYPVDKAFTLDGYEVGWNYELSAGDKKSIATLYPFTTTKPTTTTTTTTTPEAPALRYRITGLAFGDSIWSLTMSKTKTNYTEAWRTRTYFPKDEIKEFWDKKYYISNLTYGNGIWALVMSTGTGFTDQTWRTNPEFPSASIQELWASGHQINSLNYGNGVWALVMSKGLGYAHQIWRTRPNFPKDEIQEFWNQGYSITNLTYGNGLWALVMSKGAGYTGQVWRTRDHYPKDEIQELWAKGYHITHLSYGNGLWALVMSKGTGYAIQSWRTRSNFPNAEIDELWKK
jgi:hypothetical protein